METQFKKDGLPTDNEQFWIGVLHNPAFKEFDTFALMCFITPLNNIVAERIFALETSDKTYTRNKMQLSMLATIKDRTVAVK